MEILHAERADAAARAGALLRAGGIVALPTETVYGLAIRASEPDARGRLARVKQRDEGKPVTVAEVDAERALALATAVPPAARRLANRFWPGPLTLVLPAKGELAAAAGAGSGPDASVGLRVPGHRVAREAIGHAGAPVLLTSANPAGLAPALDAAQVASYLGDRVDAVVDGGRSPIGQPSTVVKLGPAGIEILRTGILTEEDVRRTAMVKVLFVCSGNTCRSPMAAALLRRALARRAGVSEETLAATGTLVGSAGMFASAGAPVSDGALVALRERSIDLSAHRSRPLTRELLDQQDHVFVMTSSLLQDVRASSRRPDRVRLLDPDGRDVVDPFGGAVDGYRACADELALHAARLAEEL